MKTGIKAHIGLLAANLFFAINISAVKYLTANHFIRPFGLNVIRVGVSMLMFSLLYFIKTPVNKISSSDIPRIILCALTGIVINQMLFLKGLSLTYPIHAVLLMLTTPILITVIAAWVLKEKVNVYKVIGLGLGVSGAIVLITAKTNLETGEQVVLGDILVIINAISYTFYFILVKPLIYKYNPMDITRWIFTIGFFMVIPFGWNELTAVHWDSLTGTAYTCIILIVIVGTFLAYILNVYGIKHLGAAVAGTYMYAQPVFAAIIAMIFLKEKLELYKILAAVLIFTGVYLSNWQKSNKL